VSRPRVIVCGGGVGGLEAVLALRAHFGTGAEVVLVSDREQFVYRPWSVGEPFGRGGSVEVDLRGLADDQGVGLAVAPVEAVDPDRHVLAAGGEELPYDQLVLALGAAPVAVFENAFTFRGPDNAAELGHRLEGVGSVAYVATASSVWPLPAYELALMTARSSDAEVSLLTAESAPLEAFGPEHGAQVARLLDDAGIELFLQASPDHFDGERLLVPMAGVLPVELVVALPALVGRPIPGIPHEETGFTPVDDFCRVDGLADVYAVGDMTTRPLKQGGLAAQQADVAAAAIAADLGEPVRAEPYEPVLRAMLLTGTGPLYLRHPRVDAPMPEATMEAPWWPPHKIAGAHLAPYLATHGELVSAVG
jgi:sulfide:quinone oxidoreductase